MSDSKQEPNEKGKVVLLIANPEERKFTFNPENFEAIRNGLNLDNKDKVAAVFSANMSHGLPLDAKGKHGLRQGEPELDAYKDAFKKKSMAGGGQAEQAEKWRQSGGLSLPLLTTIRTGAGLNLFTHARKQAKIKIHQSGKTEEDKKYILERIASSIEDFKNTAKKMIDNGEAIVLPIRKPIDGGMGDFIQIDNEAYELDFYGTRANIKDLPEAFRGVPQMIQDAVNEVYQHAGDGNIQVYNENFALQNNPTLVTNVDVPHQP